MQTILKKAWSDWILSNFKECKGVQKFWEVLKLQQRCHSAVLYKYNQNQIKMYLG